MRLENSRLISKYGLIIMNLSLNYSYTSTVVLSCLICTLLEVNEFVIGATDSVS